MRAFEFILKEQSAFGDEIRKIQQDISSSVQAIEDLKDLQEIYKYVESVSVGQSYAELFERDPDLAKVRRDFAEAIKNAPGSKEDKKKFCVEIVETGIVDDSIFTNPENDGKIFRLDDIVATDYPEIYKAMAPTLMNITDRIKVGSKAVNRGTGEFFLALLSPFINVGAPGSGDIIIRQKPFEVKSIYARLYGTKGFGTIEAGLGQSRQVIKDFSAANNVQIESVDTRPLIRNKFYITLGPTLISKNNIPADKVSAFIKSCLTETMKGLYSNITDEALGSLANSINEQGVIDYKAFVNAFKPFIFEYYRTMDKWSAMVVFDQLNGTVATFHTAQAFAENVYLTMSFSQGAYQGPQIASIGYGEDKFEGGASDAKVTAKEPKNKPAAPNPQQSLDLSQN